jgi:hypothetical protein
MSTSARSSTFRERLWDWALAHPDPLFSIGRLLSTMWLASAVLVGLLFFMAPEDSLLRLGLFVFSGLCLLAAAGAFTVVYLAGRERP